MDAKKRWINLVTIACFVFMLLALGALFLPLVFAKTYAGERIDFFGYMAMFGGRVEQTLPSGVYSFSFEVNVPLLVLTQAFLLASVACLLSRTSYFNRVFALVLTLGSVMGLCFVKAWIVSKSSLTGDGLGLGYGFVLSFVFATLAIALEILLLVFAKTPKKSEGKTRKN